MDRVDIGARHIDIRDFLGNDRIHHESVDLVADGLGHRLIAGFNGVLKRPLKRLHALGRHYLRLRIGNTLGGVLKFFGNACDGVGRNVLHDRHQVRLGKRLCRLAFHLAMSRNIDDVLDVGKLRHRRRALGLVGTVVEGAKRHLGQAPQEKQAAKRHDE